MEEQKTQNALHLRKQIEELCGEMDVEREMDREKNHLLLQQYHEDGAQLQQEVRIDADSDDQYWLFSVPPRSVYITACTSAAAASGRSIILHTFRRKPPALETQTRTCTPTLQRVCVC